MTKKTAKNRPRPSKKASSSRQNFRGKKPSKKPQPPTPSFFPKIWKTWADEVIPTFVKRVYSPKESWKNKPFSKEDAFFFFRGIEELSDLFTDERPKKLPAYFQHEKFRSSYLLYFLPLQAAKFLTAFKLHPDAVDAAIAHGAKQGQLSVADLGCGPGTASFAFVMELLESHQKSKRPIPQVDFYWFDTQLGIMKDGKALFEYWCSQFPELEGKISIRTFVKPWWEATELLPQELSLTLLGHVLNESAGPALPQKEGHSSPEAWLRIWSDLVHSRSQGGGVLCIEPAAKAPSQLLSQLRDRFIELQLIEASSQSIWGPCLHAGKCPLAEGRDWCHFSIPAQIPGDWFLEFSKGLGSERLWVKFSYLWIASKAFPAPKANTKSRRVVSDPIEQAEGHSGPSFVLLCEPNEPRRLPLRPGQVLWRGEVV